MSGQITVFTSPDLLAKKYSLTAAGVPQKEVAAQLWRGTYSVAGFESVGALAELLASVTTNQALSASLPHDGTASGRVTTKKLGESGAKVRSASEFGLKAGPGLLYLDSDSGNLSREALWGTVVTLLPAMVGAGVIWRPSGSSHVCRGSEDLTGLKGQHVYVMLADASDGPRVTQILFARMWLAGLGEIVVSKSGSLLVRSPVDLAVTDPARLIFAGGAHCGPGLEQRRGEPVILSNGGFLDSRVLIPDLTPVEQGRYEALIEQAKAAAGPEAARRHAEHRGTVIAQRLPELMRQGISATDAETRIGAAVDASYGGTLLADFQFTAVHDDGRQETVTVGDVLANRDKWHEVDILDPINPGHRQGAADCRLYLHGTSPIAYTLDSSSVFRLRAAQQRLIVVKGCRGELVSQIAACVRSDSRVFVNDAGPVLVERGRIHTLTVERLMNLIGCSLALFVKTAKADSPTDISREVAVLVLAELAS